MSKTRRHVLVVLGLLAIVFFVCLGYAYFVEPSRLVINRYEMPVAGWDPGFDGFRAALISDVHAGSNNVTPEKLRLIVDSVNRENVDAVFLLGDYITDGTRSWMPPERMASGLAGMRARYGVYAVLGNHDQAEAPEDVIKALDGVGYKVLNGEVAEIRNKSGHSLRILGTKDHTTIGIWKVYSDENKKLLEGGIGNVIVLQHSPDIVETITGDLQISPDLKVLFAGHTHGGQVWLPIIGSPIVPSSYGQKYARGHIKDRGLDIFVTTGVGTSILPFRFMVPPEIAVVTIRSADR